MAYLGEDIPKLGFGLMRLPKLEDGSFDQEQINQMVDEFMAAGFNYFDTAWMYAGSEAAIKKALVDRYPRESYILADKMAPWVVKSKEEAEAQFETSLELTGAGYFDYYLAHNLGRNRSHYFDDYNTWEFIKKKKEEGLVKHIGFSAHASVEETEAIIKAHPEMEFIQLQLNYADWDDPFYQARELYELARKYNLPVIVMEPVKGSLLANPPQAVQKMFKEAEPEASFASWAMRFAADLDGLIAVLTGSSTIEQLRDNMNALKDFTGLTDKQRDVIKKAQEEIRKVDLIQCTSCEYCAKVCPVKVGISGSFVMYNMYQMFGDFEFAKARGNFLTLGHEKLQAKDCIGCGACEGACPQKLPVMELLKTVKETFKQE